VLEDVESHLEKRFAELPEGQRTWENFQAIITNMGPPTDYAELLDTGQKVRTQRVPASFILSAAVVFAIIGAVMVGVPLFMDTTRESDKPLEYLADTITQLFIKGQSMEGFFICFIIPMMVIACLVSGPIALIVSITALKRTRRASYEAVMEEPRVEHIRPVAVAIPKPELVETVPLKIEPLHEPAIKIPEAMQAEESPSVTKSEKDALRLEQRIGTQWILIAGIITVIVGVGFFLKYAYDNAMVGPLGRVVIATMAGLIALTAGEVTRRRNYDIVAKGVTALGFAILYAAVFSAYRFYGLIGSTPAFVLAILVTAAAMLYAVSLNEMLIAVLSLLGGR